MDTQSTNLQPHENSLEELTKCRETLPWYFSMKASVATVLIMHPYVSSCLCVKLGSENPIFSDFSVNREAKLGQSSPKSNHFYFL